MNYQEVSSTVPVGTIKCMLVGDSAVGKTSLLYQFEKKRFEPSYDYTIGVDFIFKNITLSHCTVKMQIYDTAGQDRFRSIAKHYYFNVAAVVLVYDVTRRATFEHVKQWYDDVKNHAQPNTPIWLVANKIDLEQKTPAVRQVTTAEGQALAEDLNMYYVETSAKDTDQVNRLFYQAAEHVARSWGWDQPGSGVRHVEPLPPKHKFWCGWCGWCG